ncbi:recombinase family protein [Escherichia coli]|uniref:recombinase family protein n=1 Tax=Escherichia coli TaxID=562 RepID=UPI00185285B5|nr:recombinase family protein [Escherichia coli]EFM6520584.1 recombinase family protein [Escherichia coli]EIV9094752.1 recombinase family protein [Escherichia coli]HCL9682006.1 recombinase family protein [Escherichia coli]
MNNQTYFYIRVSRSDLNAENQRYSLTQQFGNPAKEFVDNGVSGSVEALKRPAFKAMFDQLQKGDRVCIYSLSRLGRSMMDTVQLIITLEKMGVTLVCQKEGFDLSTAIGRGVLAMMCAFDEAERENISERTKTALARKKAEGVKLGRESHPLQGEVVQFLKSGNTATQALKKYGAEMSRSLIFRLNKDIKDGKI